MGINLVTFGIIIIVVLVILVIAAVVSMPSVKKNKDFTDNHDHLGGGEC